MKKHNMYKKRALQLVDAIATPQGTERKRRRLAGTIAAPEPNRPRLPAQSDTAAVFDSAAWQARWHATRPTANSTSVYVAGCLGTGATGALLGVPVFKPGTARDVGARIAKLNRGRYGSLAIRNFALVSDEGWSTWEACKLSARPTHPASPVRVLPRHLAVEFPGWVTPQDVEALLVAALEPITLAHLATSPAGRTLAKRSAGGIDELLRFTPGARGPVLASEISVFAPSGDAGLLVALVEWIVIRLLLVDDFGER